MATLTVNTTLADGAVTNTKLADMAQGTVKGRAAGAGTGDPQDLTPDQASAILDTATDPFVRTSNLPADTGITQLTGDVTAGPGSGSQTATIAANAVTTGKIADNNVTIEKLQTIQSAHLLGRHGANTGNVQQVGIDGGLEIQGQNIRRAALTGDVTAPAGSNTTTIATGAVSTSKLGGDITTAGKALLDDIDAAAQRTTLGLGTLATQSGTFSGTSSGTNTGDQTITLTGDVTGSGTGSFAATIANDAVTNAKLANMATTTIKGRVSAGTGDPEDLSASQARTVLGLGTAALNNTGDFDPAANTVRGRLASDFTTNSATFVDVAASGVNFEVTLEANSTYWFYFYGIYQSANAGTGVGLSFTFSNSPTVISLFTTRVASTAQAGTVTVPSLITASDGGNIANSVTDINTNLPNFSRGLIVTGANASVVRCRIARGGAANNVTLRAGSSILAHKIA